MSSEQLKLIDRIYTDAKYDEFLDTSYINGLILKNDSYQEISNQLRYFLKTETKATNITVLVEVLNSINQNNFQGSIEDLINQEE